MKKLEENESFWELIYLEASRQMEKFYQKSSSLNVPEKERQRWKQAGEIPKPDDVEAFEIKREIDDVVGWSYERFLRTWSDRKNEALVLRRLFELGKVIGEVETSFPRTKGCQKPRSKKKGLLEYRLADAYETYLEEEGTNASDTGFWEYLEKHSSSHALHIVSRKVFPGFQQEMDYQSSQERGKPEKLDMDKKQRSLSRKRVISKDFLDKLKEIVEKNNF